MRVYQCDSCGKVIKDPYTVKMKEFYVGVCFDECGSHPYNTKKRVKIHLCENCFNGLNKITKKIREGNDKNG